MKILHIDSSILDSYSASRKLTEATVNQLKKKYPHATIDYLDLEKTNIPHLTNKILTGQDANESALTEQLIAQFIEADIVVIASPMYNFSLPSSLKAWFDRVLAAGKTFKYTENGPQGLAKKEQVYLISTKGGSYGDNNPLDFEEGLVKHLFRFTGTENIEVIRAEELNLSDEHKNKSMEKALAKIAAI